MLAELISAMCITSATGKGQEACIAATTATAMQVGIWEEVQRLERGAEKNVVDNVPEAALLVGSFMVTMTSGNPTASIPGGPICDNILMTKDKITLTWRIP
jgi:hypothetical protein